MDQSEFDELTTRITTWDQAALDRLVGRAAIEYAKNHERDVRQLAKHMWQVFPLGPRWWRLNWALGKPLRRKNDAIRERAAQIGRDRAAGKIIKEAGSHD